MGEKLNWKVHTPNLIKEVMCCNGASILAVPLRVFSLLLNEVAKRAIEIDDEKMNALMCMLTLYENADPSSKDYDSVEVNKLIKKYF